MSHGGLPPRRPDQHDPDAPRIVARGQGIQQVANNKSLPIVTQDGGIPNAKFAQAYVNDGATATLVGTNANGLRLWFIIMSTSLATGAGPGVVTSDDQVQNDLGTIAYGALVNAIAGTIAYSSVPATISLGGVLVPSPRTINLVNSSTGVTHRTSAILIYQAL